MIEETIDGAFKKRPHVHNEPAIGDFIIRSIMELEEFNRILNANEEEEQIGANNVLIADLEILYKRVPSTADLTRIQEEIGEIITSLDESYPEVLRANLERLGAELASWEENLKDLWVLVEEMSRNFDYNGLCEISLSPYATTDLRAHIDARIVKDIVDALKVVDREYYSYLARIASTNCSEQWSWMDKERSSPLGMFYDKIGVDGVSKLLPDLMWEARSVIETYPEFIIGFLNGVVGSQVLREPLNDAILSTAVCTLNIASKILKERDEDMGSQLFEIYGAILNHPKCGKDTCEALTRHTDFIVEWPGKTTSPKSGPYLPPRLRLGYRPEPIPAPLPTGEVQKSRDRYRRRFYGVDSGCGWRSTVTLAVNWDGLYTLPQKRSGHPSFTDSVASPKTGARVAAESAKIVPVTTVLPSLPSTTVRANDENDGRYYQDIVTRNHGPSKTATPSASGSVHSGEI